MEKRFSLDEVLEMAEELERNGAAFYRLAADTIGDSHMRTLLRDLAAWEEEHQKIFARMRAGLTGEQRSAEALDPKDKKTLYLRAMVDGNVFDLKSDPAELLKGKTTAEDILQIAVGKEKDSVLFYLGLKDFLPNAQERASVESIIEEEMGHIAFLNRELTTLHHQLM